jgi:hypothetical protein
MDRLKDDLDETEAALRSLKTGIDFSSRLPTEKLRREYLSNFLRAFESEQRKNPLLDDSHDVSNMVPILIKLINNTSNTKLHLNLPK